MDPAPEYTSANAKERARPTAVKVAEGGVIVTYTRGGTDAYELLQRRVPKRPLCVAVPQIAGSECTEAGGVMRSTMEETATIAVVRGDTLLVLHGLVIETHPEIVDSAVSILRDASAASRSSRGDRRLMPGGRR